MSIRIQAARTLSQSSFDQCTQFHSDGSRTLVVDLRACRFIDLYSIVALLTVAQAAVVEGRRVLIAMHAYQDPVLYLARMHFFDELPSEGVEYVNDSPPTVREHERPLLELQRLDFAEGHTSIEKLASFVWDQVPLRLRGDFAESLSEVAANVIEHAQAKAAFVVGQRFESDYGPRRAPRVHLVVGDNGIGIRRSLAQSADYHYLTYRNHADAIALALEPYVTSNPGPNSGVGLPTVKEHVLDSEGLLQIWTGNACHRETKTQISTWRTPRFTGTIVSVELCSP